MMRIASWGGWTRVSRAAIRSLVVPTVRHDSLIRVRERTDED